MMEATGSQIDYLKSLMKQLGYEEVDLEINLDTITKEKASQLIDELKKELGV